MKSEEITKHTFFFFEETDYPQRTYHIIGFVTFSNFSCEFSFKTYLNIIDNCYQLVGVRRNSFLSKEKNIVQLSGCFASASLSSYKLQ